ncbi:J domain-containing protein [Paraburkholderia phosphatilytica]|uniref:J domain-containing protein n=1 Tax=Paraburkholderia phosphatilytica TaxID=2282883 RepID=UPI000E5066FC|nr:DnaJ domain-containing protein [Paraburkholderia phosphatilytica]
MATLYNLLGVHENATDAEIKRAYRRAAMQAHPDRNVGREEFAHARFQEIKEAYSILSDPQQRSVYDAVYAEEMSRIERDREVEEERVRAEREAVYARFVSLAMRFAELGHNRDVLFGVLIGRDCEPLEAARIADSVWALVEARRETGASASAREDADSVAQRAEDVSARIDDEHLHANLFSNLWHSMFGLRG